MKQKDLTRLYEALAELRQIEMRINEWRQFLDDPDFSFGSRYRNFTVRDFDGEDDEDEEKICVSIKVDYVRFSGHLELPREIEVPTEKGMRAVVQLLVDDMIAQAEDLRAELQKGNIEL